MKKRIFLFILMLTLFTSPLYGGYYVDLLKRVVPAWYYGAALLASGFCLLKGLNYINNNWYHEKVPHSGDIDTYHPYNKKKGGCNKRGGDIDTLRIMQNNKEYIMNCNEYKENRESKHLAFIGCTQMLCFKKLIGSGLAETEIIPSDRRQDTGTNKSLFIVKNSWPSEENFRKGLKWAGLGAVGLIGYALHEK